jgi:hypothetical protein
MPDNNNIGSPSYKVIVGDTTRVLKVEVGTPTRNVLVSNQVVLEDIIGVTANNVSSGDILVADSTGELVNTKTLRNNQVIDGLVYERDSDRGYILIRRSATEGVPTNLRGGELAYSYLTGVGSGINNGGERLYIGVDSDTTGFASRIDVIGGKYFTGLLDHFNGVLTPSSAIIVDSQGYIDRLITGTLSVSSGATIDSATVTNLNVGVLAVDSVSSLGLVPALSAGTLSVSSGATINSATITGNTNILGTLFVSNIDSVSTNSVTTETITSSTANFDSVSVSQNLNVAGNISFGSLNLDDLLISLQDVIRSGDGIVLTVDNVANTITISAKLASADSAGIVRLDSAQFSVTDGITSVVNLNGGNF